MHCANTSDMSKEKVLLVQQKNRAAMGTGMYLRERMCFSGGPCQEEKAAGSVGVIIEIN